MVAFVQRITYRQAPINDSTMKRSVCDAVGEDKVTSDAGNQACADLWCALHSLQPFIMRPTHTLCTLIAILAVAFNATANEMAKPSDGTSSNARWTAWQQHLNLDQNSLFNGLKWRSIGPTVQGGRVVDVASVPNEPYTFYVAYATGGVWKTSNNGVSFEPLSDRLPTMVTGAIAVDPQHPQTVWIGSGESNSSRSSYGGMGLFRSDDGGKTFNPAGLDQTDRIARIVIDPTDSNTIYVAALGKLYSEGGARGVFRSRDGGKTWTHVLHGATPWTGAIDLVLDPRDSKMLYASLWERSRRPWKFTESGKGSGIYKSSDAGEHWERLSNGFPQHEKVGRIGLAIAASKPDTVYASVDNWEPLPEEQWDLGDQALTPKRLKKMSKAEFLRQDPEAIESFIRGNDLDTNLDAKKLIEMVKSDELTLKDLLAKLTDANAQLFDTDIKGLEIYRSDDAGLHWRRANESLLREVDYTYGYYFGQIRVAPDDAEHVYAQGLPLIESQDGGKSWHGLNQPKVHVDYHELWIDPNFPKRMIVGNDGGADVSYDGGKTWLKLDAQPLGQFYAITYDMADPYNVYGGLQDNGSYKGSSKTQWELGQDWKEIGGGDGMYVAVDPRDNATVYTGYQFGYYKRSGPNGNHEVRPRPAIKATPLRYNWDTPVILSSHQPDIVYFGANRLFRSLDKGETWSAISPDLTQAKQRGNVPYATITTISESPKQFGLIWVGTDDGAVQVTDDGGVQWRNVGKNLPVRWVSRVEASHFERNRVYIAKNGYRDDDSTAYLYRSEDLGKSWTDIAKGLPAEAINVVREDPVNENVLYVGTDRGVYVSLDRGAHWQGLQSNLPNVPVHDLAVHPRERELIVGTHGRSVWILDVLPVQESNASVQNETVKLFPVEDIQAERDWRARAALWFDESADLPKLTGTYWAKVAGAATLSVLDADKNALQVLKFDAQRGANSYEWDLLLDKTLALQAERTKLANDKDLKEPYALDKTPIAEAVRLNQRLFALPGKYTLQLSLNGCESSTEFEIKAPEARKPRAKPEPKLRGKQRWARSAAEPVASPISEEIEEAAAGK